MPRNPQEWARHLQQTLSQNRGRGGGPKYSGVAIAGLAVGSGIALFSNALFNGQLPYPAISRCV